MTFGRDVKCDSCGKLETIRTTLMYHYVLDENQTFAMVAAPTWCFDCDGIRDGEQLPELDGLTKWVAELEANGLDEAKLKDLSLIHI